MLQFRTWGLSMVNTSHQHSFGIAFATQMMIYGVTYYLELHTMLKKHRGMVDSSHMNGVDQN